MTRLIQPGARAGLNRRQLLQGASALGGAALLLPAGARSARAEPVKGGVMRFAIAAGSTSDSYDPGLWAHQFVQVFATARCSYLTEVAADGSLVGELAESWDTTDGITWALKIRKGVTFHSGKEMTVDDVVASLKFHGGDASTSAAKPIIDPMKEIKADGDNLVIVLESADADLPYKLSDYHLVVLPSMDGKIDPTSSDGTGAYKVDSYEPGVQASMSKNPNWFKEGAGHLDGVELLTIIDPAARQNALLTGEVDVIDPVDLATVAMLERGPVRILSAAGSQHYVFPMDARAKPFDDNNVRMALKWGIDRQELVDKILSGYGALGNDHPISTANRYHNGDLPQREYDADKAKYYLKQAGLDSLDVTLSASDAAFTGAVDAAQLYAEKAAAAGINITVDRAPDDGYWDNVWMKKPFCASYWGGRPTEDWMFTMAYAAGAPWNESFWDNARFNELLVAGRSELDEAKRREIYYEMQQICSDDGSTVIPMFASYVMGLSEKVGTPDKVAANWTLDGFRAPERWWLNG